MKDIANLSAASDHFIKACSREYGVEQSLFRS